MSETTNGCLFDWQELSSLKLVTVKGNEVLYLERLCFDGHSVQEILDKPKIGKITTERQKKDKLVGIIYVKSDYTELLLSMSESGDLVRMEIERKDNSNLNLKTKKTFGYICRYCFAQFKDSTHLSRHVEKLHIGPVVCPMCSCPMSDVAELNTHKKTCSYDCGVPGCEMKHTRLEVALNHNKKYMKSLE